jgi:hypothetical protein
MESQGKARFQVAGQPYPIVQVSDLGPDGCRIKVPVQPGAVLNAETLLDRLELIHPALPKDPVQARVVWVHDQDAAGTGFVETGVQFLHPPSDYTRKLSNYVTFLEPPSTYGH